MKTYIKVLKIRLERLKKEMNDKMWDNANEFNFLKGKSEAIKDIIEELEQINENA